LARRDGHLGSGSRVDGKVGYGIRGISVVMANPARGRLAARDLADAAAAGAAGPVPCGQPAADIACVEAALS